jgi:hypothetical protein
MLLDVLVSQIETQACSAAECNPGLPEQAASGQRGLTRRW